jgi:hypothetical protein
VSSSGIIIALRCMDCSKQVPPSQAVRIGESVVQCWNCYDKQKTIIESWAHPPRECALCRTSFEELSRRTPGRTVPMYPHWIDGTFGMLCAPCDKAYVLKRADQFRDTRFGWELGLK